MDLYDAKENIQPLAAGRNISILQASLRQDSPQELLNQRKILEDAIRNYEGNDPLEPWYSYICWIEQSCPSGGKESGLMEVLTKCLSKFENERRYYQDRRMIKLYIKFIDSNKDPLECYQQLFNAGIGTMTADFYIAWAYCYDLCGNYKKAEEIFRHGIACRAEPFDELQEAQQHFGYSIAQRFVFGNEEAKTDANKQLEERRFALTSLRGHRKKGQIGSIRTGSVIKNTNPGKVKLDLEPSVSKLNAVVNVFKDENSDPNAAPPLISQEIYEDSPPLSDGASAVRSIIDAARNQENMKEPGPWNKAHDKKKSSLFSKKTKNALGFEIHVDEEEDPTNEIIEQSKPLDPPITNYENNYDKPFRPPPNFKTKNKPQPEWITPVTTEVAPDANTYPQYNKCFIYPRPNIEFQVEELLAYKWFKKHNIANDFTKARDPFWTSYDINANVRMYPNFAKSFVYTNPTDMDKYYAPPEVDGLIVNFKKIYNDKEECEYSLEELYAIKYFEKFNNTIIDTADMEETVCLTSADVQRRKSFFPNRKSVFPTTKIIEIDETLDSIGEDTLTKTAECKQDISDKCKENLATSSKQIEEKIEKPIKTSKIEGIPFEIFTEDTENDFQFKQPTVPQPLPNTGIKPPPKVKFEVNDENDPQVLNPTKPSGSVASAAGGGFLDGDETFSTQTFNIFLKTQLASTPKAPQRAAPQRQFGTVLGEAAPAAGHLVYDSETPEILESPQSETAGQNSGNSPMMSPQRKQLSTILETSEHGTTHGTTGSHASTKSTISSSENDECVSKAQTLKPLETLQEAPNESNATTNSRTEEISQQLQKTHITLNEMKNPQTPGLARLLENKVKENVLPLVEAKEVGNFTRLEEREDTANAFGALKPIRFPDEKTETITKFMFTSRIDEKQNEDKTENLVNMYIPSNTAKFEEKSTGAIPKIPLPESASNMSNDSFDFFRKTPPKISNLSKRNVNQDAHTPLLGIPAKRTCDIDTPKAITNSKDFPKAMTSTRITIDDDCKQANSKNPPVAQTKPAFKKPILRESFYLLDDTVPENAPEIPLKSPEIITKDKPQESQSKQGGSFLPEVSFDPDGSRKLKEKLNNFPKNQSYISDSQPMSSNSRQLLINLQKKSEAEGNNSFIPDSQPLTNHSNNWKKTTESLENGENSHLRKSFMKDFASINQLPSATSHSEKSSSSANVSLKFLNDSIRQMKANSVETNLENSEKALSKKKDQPKMKVNQEDFFELNAETEMFAANLSMIKNSTWLPNHEPVNKVKMQNIQEESFHIKAEPNSFLKSLSPINENNMKKPAKANEDSIRLSIEITTPERSALKSYKQKQQAQQSQKSQKSQVSETNKSSSHTLTVPNASYQRPLDPVLSDEAEKTIYYQQTPKTPVLRQGSWEEDYDEDETSNEFQHKEVNLDYTLQMIDNYRVDPNINPFSEDLIKFFLDNMQFTNTLQNLPTCELTRRISRLHPHQIIQVKKTKFEIIKLIGQGAYGAVYRGKDCRTGKAYAFKQERPPSCWEYYICREVRNRLRIEELYPAFMNVDYAIVANNSSILISQLSEYGSIITVANTIKKRTNKNIDEYVVMYLTCELLSIFDHLHAIGIIHADVKADNILFMTKIMYPDTTSFCLQLIDFGVAIDMKLFKPKQTFNYIHSHEDFKCIEMREQKPWTYQLDLFGLAGIIHVMLFGKYMQVDNRSGNSYWMHKTYVPRYFNKPLWETIFRSLLNIPDCNSMPNLQQLRTSIKEEMLAKEKYVVQMINEFNKALT